MSKFENVPVEEDTAIIANVEATLEGYDVLYQKWCWDGIEAESLIFVADDVKDMDDGALKAFVAESPLVVSPSMTIKRNSEGYTFVNFNFITE